MTVLTAGAALPVLAAGAGLGLASGLTGASAAISNKIITSRQMTRANLAIEVDSAATKDLESRVEIVQKDQRMLQAGLLFQILSQPQQRIVSQNYIKRG